MKDKEIIAIYEEALRQIGRGDSSAKTRALSALQKVEMIRSMIDERSIERDRTIPI